MYWLMYMFEYIYIYIYIYTCKHTYVSMQKFECKVCFKNVNISMGIFYDLMILKSLR